MIVTTQGSLGIKDSEFWTAPLRTRAEVEEPLCNDGAEHVVLDAPKLVELDQRSTLPAVVLHVAPNDGAPRPDLAEHAVIAATSASSFRTFVAHFIQPEPDRFRPDFSGMDLPPPTGTISRSYVIDLRERLSLPWDEAETWIVRLIMRDQVLATARVELAHSASEYRDPEVARYLDQLRKKPAPAEIWPRPSHPLPSYEADASSPPVPADLGITLAVARVVPRRPETVCVLRGSFRLPVRRSDLTPRYAPSAISGRVYPTAIVPISILLIGSKYATPVLWRIAVPSFNPIALKEGVPIVTGHFAFDMQSLSNLSAFQQTYFIYAFAGEHLAGPAPMAIVHPPSLG